MAQALLFRCRHPLRDDWQASACGSGRAALPDAARKGEGRDRGLDIGCSGLDPVGKGNPDRPSGTRTRTTRAAEALLGGEAETLTHKAVKLALAGDTTALRLCLERIAPPWRRAPILVSLPELRNSSGALTAINHIVQAVARGELTPDEGSRQAMRVEAIFRDVDPDGRGHHVLQSYACHSEPVSEYPFRSHGKDGDDHTLARPQTGPRASDPPPASARHKCRAGRRLPFLTEPGKIIIQA